MGESTVSQIHGPRAPNGPDQQLPQLPIDAEGGHVAIRRRYGRTATYRRAVFQSARQGSVLSK